MKTPLKFLNLYWTGSKDIKKLLLYALSSIDWKHKGVLDFPSGSGFTSNYLKENGADVVALDMFPEFFKSSGLTCEPADLQSEFPCRDEQFDFAICQEGIEHVPDQLKVLKEFKRVLKPNGTLFLTTPNYSNLKSRLSYLCMEAETLKSMPPNEIESIWFGADSRIYYGHIFSVGVMKLRVLGKLAGLKVAKLHPTRINLSSLFWALIFYIPIALHSLKAYRRALSKNKLLKGDPRRAIFKDLLILNLHPTTLLGGHIILEFQKDDEIHDFCKDKHIIET